VLRSPFKLVQSPEIEIGIAWRSKSRSIPFSQSFNKISGDIICPYPPGIPLLVPGEKIDIEKLIIKGPKALGDENSKNTIIGEATEALIGAVYKCFNSIQEVNLWLDDIWEEDSEIFLKAPYKFKSKTVLQEWCQSKGIDLPVYKIIQVSKKNGDPKRFSCDIFIEGLKESSAFGKSHKQAETNAARVLIEKFITIGKI